MVSYFGISRVWSMNAVHPYNFKLLEYFLTFRLLLITIAEDMEESAQNQKQRSILI